MRTAFVNTLAVLLGVATLSARAADPPPQPRPCRELTGVERTKCEQQAREQNPSREQAPAPDESDPPPPDTKSESDEQSDTADPPQA